MAMWEYSQLTDSHDNDGQGLVWYGPDGVGVLVDLEFGALQMLNHLGGQGWEAYAVLESSGETYALLTYYLKRLTG